MKQGGRREQECDQGGTSVRQCGEVWQDFDQGRWEVVAGVTALNAALHQTPYSSV